GHDAHEAVRLVVRDDGPVIAPEARARLFHPFSRLDRLGDDPAGSGLGLSICHHLVTLMGGAIGCEAWRCGDGGFGGPWPRAQPTGSPGSDGRTERLREGNAFWVTLPADALPLRGVPAASDEGTDVGLATAVSPAFGVGSLVLPRRPPPRTRILLAEDVVANQRVTAMLLRREGHHVEVAASGTAAIQAIQAAPYDLVFMDILMPGMSGQEAARIIRTLPEPARSIPIVALTAHVAAQDDARFRAAGMNGMLSKPVSLTDLLTVLDRQVWSARGDPDLPATANQDGAPETSGTVPVLAAWRLGELRSTLPPATFASLVEECLVDMEHRLPALRRALSVGAPGAVAAQAHALVGMAAGYGMAAMETRLRTIMTAAREGDTMSVDTTMIAALDSDFAQAAGALREMARHGAI
ncbi:MAG TPA: response regulator, partial [Rhodopila sp.]